MNRFLHCADLERLWRDVQLLDKRAQRKAARIRVQKAARMRARKGQSGAQRSTQTGRGGMGEPGPSWLGPKRMPLRRLCFVVAAGGKGSQAARDEWGMRTVRLAA